MAERNSIYSRRQMVRGTGLAAGATLILGQATWAADAGQDDAQKTTTTPTMGGVQKTQLTPMEDLTCQHAVVGRVLLVYTMGAVKGMGAAAGAAQPPMQTLATAASMLRSNVDDHHVKLEEEYLFPLFQKAGKQTDLIATLREQHAAARRLTDTILQMTGGAGASSSSNTEPLARNLMAYVTMMQAHTAYEETLLYPQIRAVLSDTDYNQLQKTITDADRQKLGPEGIAGLLAKVADLERSAGITGLAQFTPKIATESVARESAAR